MNLVERLVARRVGRGVRSGEFVSLRPDHVLTHDNTAAVLLKFRALGARRIYDARQPVFALDHDIQNQSQANLNKYKTIEAFASEQGVAFYPAGRGIGHQIMIEEGFAFPGTFCVGADSHSNMYGGIGCLGTPVVRTDAAGIWATGSTWWQVPLVVRIELHGTLRTGVTGKDVILALCGLLNRDEVLNKAVEFTGPGIESLSVDDRLSIANMTTEWGAQTGTFPIDSKVFEWVEQRIKALKDKGVSNHSRVNFDRLAALERDFPRADPYALYFKTYRVDLSSISPLVTGPDTVKKVQSVHELERQNIRVDKAYIVSCVNSRASDLESAAQVLRGKKIAPGVELYVAAASSEVQEQSETSGAWKAIVDAGAVVLPAGCGPCIGMGAGLLKDGEVGISATNRNFKGRMGSRNAQAYLASPAVVAASALAGRICSPSFLENVTVSFSSKVDIIETESLSSPRILISEENSLQPGFPSTIEGQAIFCDSDNINTDGIYPGKYTYREDLTPVHMAAVAMENYDIKFKEFLSGGDILVAGYNFGTGSSREQAVTCLKHGGINAIVVGSVNSTYLRNALNNGVILIECPDFIEFLRSSEKQSNPTYKLLHSCQINFSNSTLEYGERNFSFSSLGHAAQDLISAGGLENQIRSSIPNAP